jgi:hypothetical protein
MTKMQTATEFLASLPAPLSRRGANRADDVTLAKTIRAECALAVTAGALPAGTKVSVRINHYKSLTVEIVAWVGAVHSPEYVERIMEGAEAGFRSDRFRHNFDAKLTEELNAAVRLVEQIADRHNYNESRIEVDYLDVGYYLTVTARAVVAASYQGIKEEMNPNLADMRARARIAAKAVGKKVVRSVCGRGGVEGCSEWSLAKLIHIADDAKGQPLMYDKSRGRWVVDAFKVAKAESVPFIANVRKVG